MDSTDLATALFLLIVSHYIFNLSGIWFLVRTIAHDLHASVVAASYVYYKRSAILSKNSLAVKIKVRDQSEARL